MKFQEFAYYKAGDVIQPQRLQVIVPAFSFSLPTWAGVSSGLGQMALNNSYYFSFKLPIKSFGSGFILAIRWAVDDNLVERFKLWEDVGEVLFYPLYNGERIGLNAFLEIWTIEGDALPMNATNQILKSSVLAFPTGSCCTCCSQPEASQVLEVTINDLCPEYGYCSPFCNPS